MSQQTTIIILQYTILSNKQQHKINKKIKLRKLGLKRDIERVFNWVHKFERKINGGERNKINQKAWELGKEHGNCIEKKKCCWVVEIEDERGRMREKREAGSFSFLIFFSQRKIVIESK
jgi:hypothetical protein